MTPFILLNLLSQIELNKNASSHTWVPMGEISGQKMLSTK